MPGTENLERLHPDDLTRTRPADESFHAAIGEHDRAVAEVRRDRGLPGDDRRRGERLAIARERCDSFEKVLHVVLVSAFRTLANVCSISFFACPSSTRPP